MKRMVSQLGQYMQEQIAKGYTKDQVVSFLQQQNYSQKDIDAAVKDLEKNQLKYYIKNMLDKGYDSNQLYAQLLDQGYNKKRLKKIFSQLDKEFYNGKLTLKELHAQHSNHFKLIYVLLAILVLVIGAYFFYDTLVDKIDMYDEQQSPFTSSKQELEEVTIPKDLEEQNEEKNDKVVEVIKDKPSLLKKSETDDDMFTNAINARDKQTSLKNCEYIKEELLQSECYIYVSEKFYDKSVCDNIRDESRYDDCYIYFILNNDKAACSKLKLVENQIFCN